MGMEIDNHEILSDALESFLYLAYYPIIWQEKLIITPLQFLLDPCRERQ